MDIIKEIGFEEEEDDEESSDDYGSDEGDSDERDRTRNRGIMRLNESEVTEMDDISTSRKA